jgi:hypothetical protein
VRYLAILARADAKDERGMALVAILVILTALTALSIGLLMFSSTEVRISNNQRNHTGALYVAEAGISEVVARMDLPAGSMVTVNGATFDASISDNPSSPDPNWRTEVYLQPQASLPSPAGTEVIVPTVQPAASWLHYGDPGLSQNPLVIEHKWIDLNGDGVRDTSEIVRYDGSRFPPENFATGLPVEVITVPGILNGSRRTIRTEITKTPVTLNVTAAVSSDNGVELKGNVSVCGHNHDINTPQFTGIPACRAYELCTNRTLCSTGGCLVGVMTTGDVVSTMGSSDVEGFPTWSDTSSTVFYEAYEYLGLSLSDWQQILASPDYTSANDATNMEGVVYVNGDATGSEKFNTNSGSGLIYVNGDMDLAGTLVWRGFIYVEGDCRFTGTAWVLGAMVVRGTTTSNAFSAGNSTVLYSRDAVQTYVGRALPFITLAWSEMHE